MGFKASIIVIHQPTTIDGKDLLEKLGLTNLTEIDEEPFEVVMNPGNHRAYLGVYKNNIILCEPDIPGQLVEEEDPAALKTLTEMFPQSEICALILHSVVNLWGYAIIRNGKKIRARAGSADNGTFVEMGEPLEEEKELLNKSTIDKNGQRTYLLHDSSDEPYTEDQVGENFVFALWARYFGEELDAVDEDLWNLSMTAYRYGKIAQERPITPKQIPQQTGNSKPWWKFW